MYFACEKVMELGVSARDRDRKVWTKLSSQNSHGEAVTLNVTLIGDGAFGN